MATPNVLVLTGYGINCDEETQFAFEKAGAKAERVHIEDLIDGRKKLSDYQILAFPGGFSYGDDTGAGNALANKIRNHLEDEVKEFVENEHLAIGICNGFQVMSNLGLLTGMSKDYGDAKVALVNNDFPRYIDRWVDLKFTGDSPWVKGVGEISVPIAHGEGKFHANSEMLKIIKDNNLVAAKYVPGDTAISQSLYYNPNGSLDNIASITDPTGRLIGMMPHPERAIDFTHLPDWTLKKEEYKRAGKEIPTGGPGIKIFENGVKYFK